MQGGMKNDDCRPISRSISETVIVRWAHAARQFVSIEFFFQAWLPQGRPHEKQKCGKNSDFGLTHRFKHRITRKLLKIDRYMLWGFGKHWIVFSSMQRFAWLPQGRPQGKEQMKAVVCKMTIFFQSNNWETVQDRWVHAARGLASTSCSIQLSSCYTVLHRKCVLSTTA